MLNDWCKEQCENESEYCFGYMSGYQSDFLFSRCKYICYLAATSDRNEDLSSDHLSVFLSSECPVATSTPRRQF
eukprot:UN10270